MQSKEIGESLREIRLSNRKTQSDVARCLSVSRPTVSQMENGNRKVTAGDVERLSKLYGCSPSALFAGPEASATPPEQPNILRDLMQALPEIRIGNACGAIEKAVRVARALTDMELRLGINTYSLGSHCYRLANPESPWEAVQQGLLAAEEERRRLNLGDAPIRDVDHTLTVNRTRMTKVELEDNIASIFLNSTDVGFLVVVNSKLPVEARRFQYAHGYAHTLFDGDRLTIVCNTQRRHGFAEVRASAFGNGFLLPEIGLRRYLQSLGKETLGRSAGTELDLFSQPGQAQRSAMVPVTGRGRRGAEAISLCDLTQIASFFGVTRSLAASRLRNLRYVTASEFESLDELNAQGAASLTHEALALTNAQVEGKCDAFRSRLVALTVTAVERGVCEVKEFETIANLVGLAEADRRALLAPREVTSKKNHRKTVGKRRT
jgi:transcriptional regulator with XRE-family HTH domain